MDKKTATAKETRANEDKKLGKCSSQSQQKKGNELLTRDKYNEQNKNVKRYTTTAVKMRQQQHAL